MLEPSDIRHLTVATGYASLEMWTEAHQELEEIDCYCWALPEALKIRVAIYFGARKWKLLQGVARKLRRHEPNNVQWIFSDAYATRKVQSVEAAKAILLEAERRFPEEAGILYNLACYSSVLGECVAGKEYLKKALELEPQWAWTALGDEDLRRLANDDS